MSRESLQRAIGRPHTLKGFNRTQCVLTLNLIGTGCLAEVAERQKAPVRRHRFDDQTRGGNPCCWRNEQRKTFSQIMAHASPRCSIHASPLLPPWARLPGLICRQPPAAAANWSGTRKATQYNAACLQGKSDVYTKYVAQNPANRSRWWTVTSQRVLPVAGSTPSYISNKSAQSS